MLSNVLSNVRSRALSTTPVFIPNVANWIIPNIEPRERDLKKAADAVVDRKLNCVLRPKAPGKFGNTLAR